MNEVYHIPAMLQETIEGLNIKPEGVYVDVTFGGGGHSRAILSALDNSQFTMNNEQRACKSSVQKGHLYSFDQDQDALANAIDDPKWTFVLSNFRYLRNWMDYYGVEHIDGLLADLGVSFHHFDCPERGFSFRFSAPLDMRMNQTAKRTAADIVNTYSEEELANIFRLYGELKNGRAVAQAICRARAQKPIERTEDLVAASRIPEAMSKELARLFQALRIEVNDELGALREMLVAARDLLKPGGRIAILTYHSLEDRLVKNFLRSGNLEGTIEKDFYGNNLSPFVLIEKGREASAEEVARNPRSRSAKLRIAEKKP
ncbi:MAG: 16S rRNA (cytosine(1402)-N(4))-methyltransferase RsmH [Paludibacteraceae bacterium]|nr:16S rRNA (cytosine(1402)-N(4))-methyltransferase RsmH [Paludibacteraceae bacterium]